MFLRNHGVVCVGETVEEAFLLTFYTVKACDLQVSFLLVFKLVSDDKDLSEGMRLICLSLVTFERLFLECFYSKGLKIF